MLAGTQKFVTSVGSLSVTVPVGCVLLVPLWFLLWIVSPPNEIASMMF